MRLDNNLYRPEHRRIDGADAILSHLRSKGERNLLSGAQQLLGIADPGGGAYDAIDGEWIEAAPSVAPGKPSRSEQFENEVTELRAEVVLLRAVCSGLVARVGRLERGAPGVDRAVASPKRPSEKRSNSEPRGVEIVEVAAVAAKSHAESTSTPQPQPVSARAAEPVPPEQRQSAATAARAESPAGAANTPGAALAEPGAVAKTGDPPVAEVPPFPFVALPATHAVSACIRQLVGDAIDLEVVQEKLPTSAVELALLDASVMVDDEGRDRAVVLSDHRATVDCGGLLLGLPKDAIQELIESGTPTADLTLAMSEIFNNLSGIVNREPNNPHLRAEALVKTPVERLPWLGSPRSEIAFRTASGGLVWLVSR